MLRIVHALLAAFSHRAWLYVDDLLALLCKHSMPQQVTIITFFLACINAPMSWRKAQLGNIVTWCGWTLHTDLESSHLAIGKLRKLQEQLEKLACSKKIPRKHLERALGLLMWATSTCTQLRPYMAPLYKDMYSGRGTLQQIHAGTGTASLMHSAQTQLCNASHWACGSPREHSSQKWDPRRSKAKQTFPGSSLPQSRSGFACRTPCATRYTSEMRAALHCAGFHHASHTTSCASFAKLRNCTAWQQQTQWQKAPRSALEVGLAHRKASHGFLSNGT